MAAALPSALAPELLDVLLRASASDEPRLVFFLDYDGTLAPIVNEPDRAFITEETRETLRRLAAARPVGLVSGRSNEKLRAFLQLDGVYLAGSHGVHVVGPSGAPLDGPDPATLVGAVALAALKAAHAALDAALGDLAGYLTEDNVFCISAHYRMVAPEEHERVREVVERVLCEHPCLKHKEGKMVHELRPNIDWDKGRAVEWLLELLEREGAATSSSSSATDAADAVETAIDVSAAAAAAAAATDAATHAGAAPGSLPAPSTKPFKLLPVYIGDDVADEDAFRAVARHDGVGIKVADGAVAPEATAATRTLTQPQVAEFLARFVGAVVDR